MMFGLPIGFHRAVHVALNGSGVAEQDAVFLLHYIGAEDSYRLLHRPSGVSVRIDSHALYHEIDHQRRSEAHPVVAALRAFLLLVKRALDEQHGTLPLPAALLGSGALAVR